MNAYQCDLVCVRNVKTVHTMVLIHGLPVVYREIGNTRVSFVVVRSPRLAGYVLHTSLSPLALTANRIHPSRHHYNKHRDHGNDDHKVQNEKERMYTL